MKASSGNDGKGDSDQQETPDVFANDTPSTSVGLPPPVLVVQSIDTLGNVIDQQEVKMAVPEDLDLRPNVAQMRAVRQMVGQWIKRYAEHMVLRTNSLSMVEAEALACAEIEWMFDQKVIPDPIERAEKQLEQWSGSAP